MNAGAAIRTAVFADVDAILDLIEAVTAEDEFLSGEVPLDRIAAGERYARRINNRKGIFFVAYADAELRGLIYVTAHPEYGDMLSMAIAKAHRGAGLGTRLMRSVVDWAHERRLGALALLVFAHNAAAIALYRKFGFIEIARYPRDVIRSSGKVWDTLLMRLELP